MHYGGPERALGKATEVTEMLERGVRLRPPLDHRLESTLIVRELETLIERRPLSEARQVRSFVASYRAATQRGNPAGILVAAIPAKPGMVAVAAHIPGVGRVAWLPMLTLPMSNRLESILRRVGRLERFPATSPKATPSDAWPGLKPPRRAMPPKEPVRLIHSR